MTLAMDPIAAGPRDHVVHFYEEDSELARTVVGYLGDAAADGAVAVVIATNTHRRAFEAELAAAGIDPDDARADARLVFLDAHATMASFRRDGRIDAEVFEAEVGSVMRRAAATGRPVCAYGEMVALLWEDGDVLAAIELEKLWNALGQELEFSLLCAYRSATVHRDEHAEALQQICHLHSSVWPGATRPEPAVADGPVIGAEISAEFPAERDAPRSARHFVGEALERWGHSGSFRQDAELVVTELATNSVVHALSPFSVAVRANQLGVRIAVHDDYSITPTLGPDDPLALSGRGLRLVQTVSESWGVDLTPDGKVVWAELRP